MADSKDVMRAAGSVPKSAAVSEMKTAGTTVEPWVVKKGLRRVETWAD